MGEIPHSWPVRAPWHPGRVLQRNFSSSLPLGVDARSVPFSARALRLNGRRRVIHASDWVATPNASLGQAGPPFNPRRNSIMKWTKPEAEVVAVTMEVTAYVATL